MTKYIMIKLFAIVSFLFFVGCYITNPIITTDTIINKYERSYIEISSYDYETDNHDIAAILKTFSVGLINSKPKTWQEVYSNKEQYMISLKTDFISSTYTILASDNEIKIVDSFLNDILYYSVIEEYSPYMSGKFVSDASSRFIIKLDNYEYDKFK